MDYLKSTQRLSWTKTIQELNDIRGKLKANENTVNDESNLNIDEELAVTEYYIERIREICMSQHLEEKYKKRLFWSAATLFKRYFIGATFESNNPLAIAATSIFVAAKVEEIPMNKQFRGVDIEDLKEISKIPSNQLIIGNEIKFLGGVKFHLVLFHPIRPLHGFMHKLGQLRPEASWEKVEARAEAILEDSLYGDFCFLYSPGQLAVAALSAVFAEDPAAYPFSLESILSQLLPESANKDVIVSLFHELLQVPEKHRATMQSLESNSKIDNKIAFWKAEIEEIASRPAKRKHDAK